MILTTENESLHISSKAENIVLVEKFIDEVCSIFKVNEEVYGNILVALTEAVNNAIQHGNQNNPNKNVDVSFKYSPEQISFTIKDEGAGFDYTNLPDPTDPKNIEKLNGRGVFLMRNLADKVSFEENGSKVILDFNLLNA
jgi:serine/threonine-protein kinase RsbW